MLLFSIATWGYLILRILLRWDFPGGPVVGNPGFHWGKGERVAGVWVGSPVRRRKKKQYFYEKSNLSFGVIQIWVCIISQEITN